MNGFLKASLALLLCLCASGAQGAVNYGTNGSPLGGPWNKGQSATLTNNQICAANRIPNQFLRTSNGKLLSFIEVRNNATNDANCFAICVRVSSDQGQTWGPIVEILTANPPSSASTVRLALGAAFELADGRVGLVCTYWTAWADSPTQAAARGVQLFEVYTTGTDYEVWSDTGAVTGTGGTEITSTTVKTNNTTPITMPEPINTTNGAWVYMLPTSAVTLPNGDVVVGCVVRYTDVDVSYFVTLKRTAAGVWSILGGLEESSAASDDMNESTMAVVNGGAYILCVMRDRQGGQYKWAKSSDGGINWTSTDGAGIPTAIGVSTAGGDVQPDMIVDPDDSSKVYFAGPNETIRANMTVWNVSVSSGTPTFGTSLQIDEGRSSYPGIECFSGGKIVCIWEATENYSAYSNDFQMIRQATFQRDDIGGTPASIDYHFNEKSSGAMLTGPTVISHGMPAPGFGNTAWSYTSAGVTNDGSTGFVLDPARSSSTRGTALNVRGGSFTFEIVGDFSSVAAGGALQAIAGTRDSTGAGWTLVTTSASKKPIFRFNDGTTTFSVTNDTLLDSASDLAIVCQFDATAQTIQIWVNGTPASAATSTATMSVSGTSNQKASTIGEAADGSSPCATGMVFKRMRFTRAVTSSSTFLTTSSVKTSLAKYVSGYDAPSFNPLTLYPSNCKLWVAGFSDGGMRISADKAAGISPFGNVQGNGVLAVMDYTADILFANTGGSLFRNAIIDKDSYVGPSVRILRNTSNGATPGWQTPTTNTSWEFIQKTGRFTIVVGAIKFNHTTGNAQEIILDNRVSTGSNAGFTLLRDSSARINFAFSYDTVPRIDANTGATTFANGTWYTIAVVADGDASTCNLYWKAWPGNLAAPTSLTGPISLGTVAGDDGTGSAYTADQPLAIATRTGGDTNSASISFKDIMIFDDDLSTSQILALVQNSVYAGPSAPAGNGLNLGIGIGLGANERPRIKVPDEFTLAP